MKRLCVLGITGSIGRSTADIVRQNPGDFEIVGVALYSRVDLLEQIMVEHGAIRYIYVGDSARAEEVRRRFPEKTVWTGPDQLVKLIDAYPYDMVVNALVGFAGLAPTLHTLEKGIDCALANKESLVVGGELIGKLLKRTKAHLYPIDSEHVAIQKCLKGKRPEEIDSILLTASGGPFRDLERSELAHVSVEQALCHPSWRMGSKITIDSATMINKGFELIEAYYLFGVPMEKIHILLHDESVLHSAVQLCDHSIVADLGPADMRIPIAYALYEETYHPAQTVGYLKLEDLQALHFRKYDPARYPGVELAKQALRLGGSMPCVLNAANEAVNAAFRQGRIRFDEIEEIIGNVMKLHRIVKEPELEDLTRIHMWAWKTAEAFIGKGE